MTTWVNSLTIQKVLPCLRFIWKEFPRTMSNVLPSRTLSSHVCRCVNTCCLRTCLYTHRNVNVLGNESRFIIPGHCNQVCLNTVFCVESHPSSHGVSASPPSVNHTYHKITLFRQDWYFFERNVCFQRNLVYKAFHRIRCCRNETNC